MPWPPKVGDTLPRAAEATGVRRKLSTYSLDQAHQSGGPKARGFELILGITIRDIGYLEGAIQTGVQLVGISEVRDRLAYGFVCGVRIPVRGLGGKSGRTVMVTTAWMLDEPGAAPRLVNALIRD
jgi:hypothetical protein